MELQELYQQLEKYKDFEENEDHVDMFLEVVYQIVQKQDPSSLPLLLKFFNDETQYSWIGTSIRKCIEAYPQKDYINNLLVNLNSLISKSPLWTDEIFNSIFNDENDFKYFCSQLHLANKDDLLKLLDVMERQSPHHHERIQTVREILRLSNA